MKSKLLKENAWSAQKASVVSRLMMPEIRSKILWTLLFMLIYRLGCAITIPFVTTASLENMFSSVSILDYYNLISGGALSQCAVLPSV